MHIVTLFMLVAVAMLYSSTLVFAQAGAGADYGKRDRMTTQSLGNNAGKIDYTDPNMGSVGTKADADKERQEYLRSQRQNSGNTGKTIK